MLSGLALRAVSEEIKDHRRRDFLRRSGSILGAASALSLFPPAIRRALAVQAQVETGTIQDVKHVVILMQENRSFDHYFGTLRGVRGDVYKRQLHEQWAFMFALREPRAARARLEAQCEPCLPAARERSGTYGLTR